VKRIFVLVLLVLLCCSGCSQHVRQETWAMDTYMDIQIWGKAADPAASAVKNLLTELENTWSATDGNSVIGRLNRGETVTLTQEQEDFLEQAELLSERTGGAFDPKLRSVCLSWGFTDGAYRVPTGEELNRALEEKQWDLGAAVKGYAGMRAVALLQEMDVTHAILNLGGNVQTYGEKPDGTPWRIGIQDPEGGEPLGILFVQGTMAVVTSGDYQRYFEADGKRYHHILDPQTGYPVENGLRSVTVICENGLWADVMSTAMFVMGHEDAIQFWQDQDWLEAVLVMEDGRILATEGVSLSGCEYEVIAREK